MLLKNLNQLKEKLNHVSSLTELDLITVLSKDYFTFSFFPTLLKHHFVFVDPFLEVIRSEDTSGPVTELALSAIFKFLSYGLIGMLSKFIYIVLFKFTTLIHYFLHLDPRHESTPAIVESLADAVTHARFVGTDSGSDEVVLMKILHVRYCLFM